MNESETNIALERVVANLVDGKLWQWTRAFSQRDGADRVLTLLAREGLIEACAHPMGGRVFRVNNTLYGRTSGVTHEKFDEWKSK